MHRKLLLFIFICSFFISHASAQETAGKDFWVAFMDLDFRCQPAFGDTTTMWSDDTAELYISSEFAANVTIKIGKQSPAGSGIASPYSKSFTVTPHQVYYVKLPSQMTCHTFFSDLVTNNGAHITADTPIYLKAVNRYWVSKGATTVIPSESIPFSPEYFISTNASDNTWSCGIIGQKIAKSPEFVVVGISANSVVEIIPSGNSMIRNTRTGIPVVIYLKQGETFQYGSGNEDLTGTIIRAKDANSKFSVFAANRVTNSSQLNTSNQVCKGGADHTYEQLIPTVNWGKTYTALPFKNNYGGYYLKILAAEDSTQIHINGIYQQTLRQGDFFTYNVNADSATRITSDKKISVAQFAKANTCNPRPGTKSRMGDVSELMLISDRQFCSNSKIHKVSRTINWWGSPSSINAPEDYMNILVKTADTSSFRVNGKALAVNLWQRSYSISGYVYAQLDVDSTFYNLYSPKGFIAYAYGYGSYEGYSYSAGESFRILNNNFTFNLQCALDTISFSRVKNDSFTNYSWNFGDKSGIQTGPSIKHIYKDTGWIKVSMYCRHVRTNAPDSVSKTIYIAGGNFIPVLGNDTVICGKLDFPLYAKNFSTDNIYSWNDKSSLYYTSIKKPGKYWLKVTERSGCSFIDTINVKNFPFPFAKFSLSDTGICLNKNRGVIFNNASTASDSIAKNTWNFGDTAIISSNVSIKHLFKQAGKYKVRLTVTSNHGCEDDTVRTVTIAPSPKASFVVSNMDSCLLGNQLTLTNTTVIDSALHKSFKWFFSEGFFLNNTNPAGPWNYALPGKYAISLVYSNTYNCVDTFRRDITIYSHPKAAFGFASPYQCLSDTLRFVNKTSSAYTPLSFKWNFGDALTDTAANPKHLYAAKGIYPVKLLAMSPQGCKDSLTTSVRINSSPKADFSINDALQCLSNNRFLLKNTSVTDTGAFISRLWQHDDSTLNINTDNVSKAFLYAGQHAIKLKVVNIFGCADSIIKIVEAKKGPEVRFSINDASQCLDGNTFDVNYIPVPANGSISSMTWYYHSDSAVNVPAVSGISFPAYGTYPIALKLYDSDGCATLASRSVLVNPAPKVQFATTPLSAQCLNGNSFGFNEQSSIPIGNVSSFKWDFGDLTTSLSRNPSGKVYTAAGTFKVTLTAYSDSGCADTASAFVQVHPNANISIAPVTRVCLNDSSVFSAAITGGTVVSYLWDFGDLQTSGQLLAKHRYASPGVFNISLSTQTDKGCKDSKALASWVTVYDLPHPEFKYRTLDGGNNNTIITFTDINSPQPRYRFWDFDAYGKAIKADTSMNIKDSGTIHTRLFVTDNNGCTGMTEKYIFVAPPSPIFFPNTFSPNGDGHNDGFSPVGVLFASNYTFKIFNRWGEILFISHTPGEAWDGNYQGKTCPNGMYYYHLELNDFNGLYKTNDGMLLLRW